MAQPYQFLTIVFSEPDDKSLFVKSYGEQKLGELLVLNKVEIEGKQGGASQQQSRSRKPSNKPELLAPKKTLLLGPTKQSLETLTKTMAFLIKFSSIIAENARVQFAILIHVDSAY